jgi:putative protease
LPAVVATGVSALKIEGRNKSPHYVASVVKVYREALDACLKDPGGYRVLPWWSDELDRLDHRPYTTGFYAGEYRLQETGFSQVRPDVRVVGSVKSLLRGGEAVVDVKNPFSAQETLHILPVGFGERPYELRLASLTDMNGVALDRALTNRVVLVHTQRQLRVGDMLRRSATVR